MQQNEQKSVPLKPHSEFPLLETYKEYFPVDDNTIFAYNGVIYSNYDLPDHLLVHEKVHLRQQEQEGLENWVQMFLKNPSFRLSQELEAYKEELESITDRNYKAKIRVISAKNLSSELYGGIITFQKALDLLK